VSAVRRTLIVLASCYAVAFALGIACILAAPSYIKKNLPAYAKKHASLDASVSGIRYTKRGIEVKGLRIKTADKDITIRQLLFSYPRSELRGIACAISREDGKKITILTDADVVIQRDRSLTFSAPSMKVDVLGASARIAAQGTIKGVDIEATLMFKDVDWGPALKFFEKDEDFSLSGLYDGSGSVAAHKGVLELDISFLSKGRGIFSDKKAVIIDMAASQIQLLKKAKETDPASYRAMLEKNKDVLCDSSTLTFVKTKDQKDVILLVDLVSEQNGPRHFEIGLHDFL